MPTSKIRARAEDYSLSQLRYRPICLPLYYSTLLKKIQPFFSFSHLFFCPFYRGLTRIAEWATIKTDILFPESRFHRRNLCGSQNRRRHRAGLPDAGRSRHSGPQGTGRSGHPGSLKKTIGLPVKDFFSSVTEWSTSGIRYLFGSQERKQKWEKCKRK